MTTLFTAAAASILKLLLSILAMLGIHLGSNTPAEDSPETTPAPSTEVVAEDTVDHNTNPAPANENQNNEAPAPSATVVDQEDIPTPAPSDNNTSNTPDTHVVVPSVDVTKDPDRNTHETDSTNFADVENFVKLLEALLNQVLPHDNPVTEEETAPATEEPADPVTDEPTVPATEETTPATDEPTAPVTEEPSAPVTEETTPATKEPAAPVTEETTPVTDEPTVPVTEEDTAPATEETTPVTEESDAPVTDEPTVPTTEETTPATPAPAPEETTPTAPVTEEDSTQAVLDNMKPALTDYTNQYREAHGLAPVKESEDLNASAQAWADHLAATGEFTHDTMTCNDNLQCMSENIAITAPYHDDPAKDTVDRWYNSPGHQANMLRPTASEVGHGTAYMDKGEWRGRYVVVQRFWNDYVE